MDCCAVEYDIYQYRISSRLQEQLHVQPVLWGIVGVDRFPRMVQANDPCLRRD